MRQPWLTPTSGSWGGFRKRLSGAGLLVREFRSSDSLELEVFHALSELATQWPGAAVHQARGYRDYWKTSGGTACEQGPPSCSPAAYMSALAEPLTPAGDMPVGLKIPTLEAGYIDHRIRVTAGKTASSEPGRESWWADVPINDSAPDFLFASLTSREALTAPLVLLGQPGSGKSVLTRILAAQFSTAGFLPVRVELRQADVEGELQEQIEFAIRSATGEITRWPEVVESGDRVLPVVIFDGFDELLQATGVLQSDFLLRVHRFQEREARLGRPLAVIVTSRTAVTDRARFPHGTTVVRLEPFDKGQISAWLNVWDRTNRVSLAERGMRPLPVNITLRDRGTGGAAPPAVDAGTV